MKKLVGTPKHLEPVEGALFERIQAEYGILDSSGIALLTLACESAGVVRQCRERITLDGAMTAGGRAHPLFAVQRDARNAFLACIRQLGLDIEGGGTVGGQIHNTNRLQRVK